MSPWLRLSATKKIATNKNHICQVVTWYALYLISKPDAKAHQKPKLKTNKAFQKNSKGKSTARKPSELIRREQPKLLYILEQGEAAI